jgi:serine/threonine protein kinase
LEVLSGFPLWLSLKSRVSTLDNRSLINYGLFGVAGRDNSKILLKQGQLMGQGLQNLFATLKKGYDFQDQAWMQQPLFIDLICRMLSWNPFQRISPNQILTHQFLFEQPQQLPRSSSHNHYAD